MRIIALVLTSLVLAACGPKVSVVHTNTSPKPRVSRPASAVEVFTTRPPSRPYTEIAVLNAERGQPDDHLEALRVQAGELGCDGLVMTVMPSVGAVHVSGLSQPGQPSNTATGSVAHSSSGTCVMYTEPSAQTPIQAWEGPTLDN